MRTSFTLGLILLFILFPIGALSTPLIENGSTLTGTSDPSQDPPIDSVESEIPKVPIPGPDLGTTNWTSNHFQNPRFENWSDAYRCDGWTSTKTGDRHHWIETTQVSDGSYAGGFHSRNYPDQFEHATIEQSTIDADFSNITLSFDWYLDQNADPSEDAMYAEVQIQDGTFTYWLFYYLNGSSAIDQNSTWEGYFVFNMGPAKQWNSFSRNLTADFLSVAELQGSYSELLYVDNIRFHLETFGVVPNLIRGYVDNMKLLNETNSHYFINQTMRNGNFETGDFTSWTIIDSTDSGYFKRSSSAHAGSFSANVTAYSVGNYSEANFRDYPYVRLTSSHQGQVSLWWYLSTQNLTTGSYAYIVFEAYDGTAERDIYYLLSYGGTSSPLSNGSTSLVFHADSFNTTGVWNQLDTNLWSDAISHYTLNELMVNYVEVVVIAEGTEALMSLLIDDVSFQSATLNHRDFEDQPNMGQRVQGFTITYSRITVTGTAYSGSKAGNLTLMSGSISFAPPRLPLQWRPLNSSRETYLDVMWRIVDTIPSNQVWFRLIFTNGYELNYYMNGLTTATSNTSSEAYFNVTSAGTIGSWIQMHRDLVHDYEAVFGSLPDTTMDTLYVRAFTSARLEFLFDDFYLYDDPGPVITNVGHTPGLPDINEEVDVTADIVEQDFDTATLDYRVDGGGWQTVGMTLRGGNTYNATILGQTHGTVIEYYLTASDTWGLTTTALNGGSYWTYTVTDQTAPSIDTVTQTPSTVNYLDSVNVTAEITEEGSGLQSIQLYWRLNGGNWNISAMITTGSSGYYAIIGPENYNIFVEYYVNATDNADLQGIGSTYSYTVTDTIPPGITNLAHIPISVEYTDSPTVRCNVTDAQSGVATVVLYYQVDGGGWNTIPMSPTTGTGYAGSIPAQAWNAFVNYYVNATDNAGAWTTSSGSYTVGDNVDPQITNTGQTPGTVEYTDSPVINCDATDAGSGIGTVTLYYRVDGSGWSGVSMTYISGFRYEGSISAQSWNAIVEYYIVAEDNAGNSVTDDNSGSYYSYTVEDNADPIIQNVVRNLTVVQYNDTVLVSCTASDVGSGISGVMLYYRNGSGSWYSIAMTFNGSHYARTLPPHHYGALVEYYVSATDNAGNSATSSISNFTTQDDYNPVISNVAHWPAVVSQTDSPEVSCYVNDAGSGVGSVTLYYRINGIDPFTSTAMIHQGDGQYNATIPPASWEDLVEYYITATDNAGNLITDDFGGLYYSYTIGDSEAPTIQNVGHTPLDVEYDDSPLVECDVTDVGSGVQAVVLSYRVGTTGPFTAMAMTHTGLGHYTTNIPAQSYASTIQFYINASDWANNFSLDPTSGSYHSYTVVDNTSPSIFNLWQSPTVVEGYNIVLLSCNVTDFGSGVNSVQIIYRIDGGSWVIFDANQSDDQYGGFIPGHPYNSFVEYYFNATDNANNIAIENNGGSYFNYTIVDTLDPAFWDVEQTPSIIEYDDSPQISCNVTDSNGSGVKEVILYYRIDRTGIFTTILMTDAGSGQFTALIPIQLYGTVVEYFINATDNAGNWKIADNAGSYFNYTVTDYTDPILRVSPSLLDDIISGVIELNITASDGGSGIARIEITVDGEEVFTTTNSTLIFNWDTTLLPDGRHYFLIEVFDNADNMDSRYYEVDTLNAPPPPPIPGFPFEGIIIGLTLIISTAIYTRRRRRREPQIRVTYYYSY